MKYLLLGLLLIQYTLSVDVDLVLFNVSVLDRDGRAVSGLTAEHFRVFEDDRLQQIRVFQREDSPATVGLVIDNSGSMVNRRRDIVTAATAFVSSAGLQDEIFIVNFNRRVWMGLPPSMPFTGNINQLRTALLTTTADGTTALYDALDLALTHLTKGMHHKKAIVLLSDGGDNASMATLKEVLQMAQRSSATIYAIGIYDQYQKDRNPALLQDLAKLTGGQAFFPKNPGDLHEIWHHVAGSIRRQYTIGFVSNNPNRDGSFRKVEILAVDDFDKPLEVRTRAGYFAPSASSDIH